MSVRRINHFLSAAGACSRRSADRLVRQGRVKVNGDLATLGQKVSREDAVLVDGKSVSFMQAEPEFFYRLYHKPKGVVCTQNTEVAGNLMEALSLQVDRHWPNHYYAVGRLDKESEGLLLLTNHGVLANHLLQEDRQKTKKYLVTVQPEITFEFLSRMASGVEILNQNTLPCEVFRLSDNVLQIELTQGLNRQIRRMCQALGHRVERLIRVGFAGLPLDIPAGETRGLSKKERHSLQKMLN